jgi:hypothetical protein
MKYPHAVGVLFQTIPDVSGLRRTDFFSLLWTVSMRETYIFSLIISLYHKERKA